MPTRLTTVQSPAKTMSLHLPQETQDIYRLENVRSRKRTYFCRQMALCVRPVVIGMEGDRERRTLRNLLVGICTLSTSNILYSIYIAGLIEAGEATRILPPTLRHFAVLLILMASVTNVCIYWCNQWQVIGSNEQVD